MDRVIRRRESGLRLAPRPGGAAMAGCGRGGAARAAALRLAAAVAMAAAAGSLAASGAAMPGGDGDAGAPAAEFGPDGLPLPGRPPAAPPMPSPLIELLRAPPTAGGTMEEEQGTLRTAALLPEPPPAPPPPVALEAPVAARRGGAAEASAADPLAGVESGPGGGYRLRVTAGAPDGADAAAALDPETARAAESIGRRLAAAAKEGGGRVTVLAQVAAPPGMEVSAQRRLALARALAVKGALVAGGVDPTRIDLRPLGRTEEGVDAVDILPPADGPPGGPRRDAAGAGAVTR
ncbi:hypothetical protein GCM10010964_14690 [Caldovatus sediminis]|uniref:OmpA-like domain-containing protein n=1 Tax=Caldovatus sediminis TaxID=2041189 RepID=A0A8J2Z9M0_9PROT|nr:hypothetical protein [Caldovatus sediminis]GGG27822.1 hypothetical protein GCM10010964_14690 [Caldovatus sediminis]